MGHCKQCNKQMCKEYIKRFIYRWLIDNEKNTIIKRNILAKEMPIYLAALLKYWKGKLSGNQTHLAK